MYEFIKLNENKGREGQRETEEEGEGAMCDYLETVIMEYRESLPYMNKQKLKN